MLDLWRIQLQSLRAKFDALKETDLHVLLTMADHPWNSREFRDAWEYARTGHESGKFADGLPIQSPSKECWIEDKEPLGLFAKWPSDKDNLIHPYRIQFFGNVGDNAVTSFLGLARSAGLKAFPQWDLPLNITPPLRWVIQVFRMAMTGGDGFGTVRRIRPLLESEDYFGNAPAVSSYVLDINIFIASTWVIDCLCPMEVAASGKTWIVGTKTAINTAFGVSPTYGGFLDKQKQDGILDWKPQGRQFAILIYNDAEHERIRVEVDRIKRNPKGR